MKNYELTYLVSPDLPEQDIKNLTEKINNLIQEEAGKAEKSTEPSKKKLAYHISKKESAFLVSLNFYLSPEKLGNLEQKLKSQSQILRYTIMNKKVIKKVPSRKILAKKEKPPIVPRKTTETKKVELKEIDKKIEEILNE